MPFWNNLSHVPTQDCRGIGNAIQGYLAHKKTLTPQGPPWAPWHRATVGSYGEAFSYERVTPAVHRVVRCRAKRAQLEKVEGLLPERQGQNLALIVLHVSYSPDGQIVVLARKASLSRLDASSLPGVWVDIEKELSLIPHTGLSRS